MRIVFFGSDSIGFPLLDALLTSAEDELVAVVTQPDRPVGRKLKLTPCPVKAYAEERGLVVFSPEKVGSAASVETLSALRADLFVVVAYGQYIPSSILALPPQRAINLHPSLLPKYRGSSPIQWALANGDQVTGSTLLYVSQKMDSGDIILQRSVPIGAEDDALSMSARLSELGAELLKVVLEQIRSGTVQAVPQDEACATEVRKLCKEDGRVDWTQSAQCICNRIRAFIAWPGCFFEAPGRQGAQRVKVLRARVEEGCGSPGEVLDCGKEGPLIAAGEGALRLLDVQPAGKKVMAGSAYLRGYPLAIGSQLS